VLGGIKNIQINQYIKGIVLRNTDQYQEEFGIEIDEKEIKNIKEWSVE
jgi:hypothetical protein